MLQNEFNIKIKHIERVRTFINICSSYKQDIDIRSGRYIVDAKSIMAILSFDLTKILKIKIHTNDAEVIAKFNNDLRDFKADNE